MLKSDIVITFRHQFFVLKISNKNSVKICNKFVHILSLYGKRICLQKYLNLKIFKTCLRRVAWFFTFIQTSKDLNFLLRPYLCSSIMKTHWPWFIALCPQTLIPLCISYFWRKSYLNLHKFENWFYKKGSTNISHGNLTPGLSIICKKKVPKRPLRQHHLYIMTKISFYWYESRLKTSMLWR